MSTPDSVAAAVLSIQPLSVQSGGTPSTTASTVDSQLLAELQPGDKVPVFVLSSQPNGRFYVDVQNQLLDMNLPPGTQTGQSLELQVVSNSPGQLVFSLPNPAAGSTETAVDLSAVSRMLQQVVAGSGSGSVAQLLASSAPLTETPLDTPQLASQLQATVENSGLFYESRQLQWTQGQVSLQDLMQQPQAGLPASGGGVNAQLLVTAQQATLINASSPASQGAGTTQATAAPANQALASNTASPAASGSPLPPTTNSAATATGAPELTNALSAIGITLQNIETAVLQLQHGADATATATPTATPVVEPDSAAATSLPQTAAAAQTMPTAAALPNFDQMERLAQSTAQNLVSSVNANVSANAAATAKAAGVVDAQSMRMAGGDTLAAAAPANTAHAPDVHSLVQQQLNVLENQHLHWQGQVWPGQTMDWEIAADGHGNSSEGGEEQAWSTRLALNLPNLGPVVAKMQLVNGQLNISFLAAQPQTASALINNQGQLSAQLAAASLPLNPISVAVGTEDSPP